MRPSQLFYRGAVCAAVAVLVTSCASASDDATGTLRAAMLAGGPSHDVASVRIDVLPAGQPCDAAPLDSADAPLEAEALPSWLEPDGSGGDAHAFADALFVLAPGEVTVCATPLTEDGTPSAACSPVTANASVLASETTEIVLMSQCEGDPSGGLDVVVALNDPPRITGLAIDPSKFVTICQAATLSATASDPNGDALTYTWTLVGAPPDSAALLEADGPDATLMPDLPGEYAVQVTVDDGHGATASLTVPVHASGGECCVVPTGHPTIQAAVDAGCPEVDVLAGVYPENVILDGDVVIRRLGGGTVTVDGQAAGSVVTVASGTIRLESLSLTNGLADEGAGILNAGDLTLEDTSVSGNIARSSFPRGGGIFSSGSLVVAGSSVNGNFAETADGGSAGDGGGIYVASGPVSIVAGSAVAGNTAFSFSTSTTHQMRGGGMSVASSGGPVLIEDSSISANRVIAIGAGFVRASGGGIYTGETDITVVRSRVVFNEALASSTDPAGTCNGNGGGVYAETTTGLSLANVVFEDSSLSGNMATGTGAPGAFCTASGAGFFGSAGTGDARTSLVFHRSLASDNTASGDVSGRGGAFFGSASTGFAAVVLEVLNSTVSSNAALSTDGLEGEGAGAYLRTGTGDAQALMDLASSTVTGNVADLGGALFALNGISNSLTAVTYRNSISWGNSAVIGPECRTVGTVVVSEGRNLWGDLTDCAVSGGASDFVGVSPDLGPLGPNGGPTDTHALLPGSPAIDGGLPGGCVDAAGSPVVEDQRGMPRPAGAECDLGAYEAQP